LKFYVTFADAQLPIRYDYARATDRRSNVKGKVGIPADITVNVKQTTLFFFNMVIAESLFPNLKHFAPIDCHLSNQVKQQSSQFANCFK
jgi:hypothetical protein